MLLLAPTIRPAENLFEDWMFVLFTVCVGFFSFYMAYYHSKIKNVFRGFRSDVLMRQLMREENITPRSYFFLALLYGASISLLAVLTLKYFFTFQWSALVLFYSFWIGTSLIYLLKSISIRAIQWLIEGDFTLLEYRYRTFMMNRLMGILLFPILIWLTLTDRSWLDESLLCTWLFIAIAWIWRVFKGAWVAFQSRVPLFFIFFYICTLEILPLAIGLKFFFNSLVD